MVTKILVYDNQLAYFELLKTSFPDNFQFSLIGFDSVEDADLEYNMVVFFIYNEIELLDFAKLYTEEKPFILGFSGRDIPVETIGRGNIQYLNLNKLKNELITDVEILLKTIL